VVVHFSGDGERQGGFLGVEVGYVEYATGVSMSNRDTFSIISVIG
jgi:hypothetical protein